MTKFNEWWDMQDKRNRDFPDMAARAAWKAQQKRIDKLEEGIFSISDDHQAIYIREAEPVAVIGDVFQLLWCGNPSFSEHVNKHNLKVGTFLYTTPPIIPEGYALVPIEPTDAMLRAAQLADGDHGDHEDWLGLQWEMGMDQVWSAMLEAAKEG